MRTVSIYSMIHVPGSWRAKRTPRVHRKFRPKVIAWAGPFAFYPNRFYELDTWYKARIDKPALVPQLHVIDPDRIFKTYEERMAPAPVNSINIGFKKAAETTRSHHPTFERAELEKLARKNQLEIDTKAVDFDQLIITNHHRVFEHLFMPGVYFHNTQGLQLSYGDGAEVHLGNCIPAALASQPPRVMMEKIANAAGKSSTGADAPHAYNTLLMLSLDGFGFTEQAWYDEQVSEDADEESATVGAVAKKSVRKKDAAVGAAGQEQRSGQLLHWMVANIPGDSAEVKDGEAVVPYLQPIPFYGTGYHRIAFILFRHQEPLELESYCRARGDLLGRRFEVMRFLKKHENVITPSAIRFCQMQWDESCDEVLRAMGLKCPRYWYEWSAPLTMKQKEFPLKPMPFNHYLDMFRPPEVARKQVQREKLEELVKLPPGTKHLPKPRYPDIFYKEHKWDQKLPFWLHEQQIRRNTGSGIYAALYEDYVNPATQHLKSEEGVDDEVERLRSGVAKMRVTWIS